MTSTKTNAPDGAQQVLNFEAHLERVSERISGAILRFCRTHPGTWHMDELRRAVAREVGEIAPASPDRVLRSLRQQHRLYYQVVSRRESLYRVTWIE